MSNESWEQDPLEVLKRIQEEQKKQLDRLLEEAEKIDKYAMFSHLM